MGDQEKKTCDDCAHLKENRACREGPPQMFMIPGAPKGTIAMPGQIPMTIILKYLTPPPGFPACDRIEEKVDVGKILTGMIREGMDKEEVGDVE